MSTNLPSKQIEDSAASTRLFFDVYGRPANEFSANDVSATVGFFESKGFNRESALSVSSAILIQAKADGIPVYSILEKIKGFDKVELNALITEILNNDRPKTSTLGFRAEPVIKTEITRNISA